MIHYSPLKDQMCFGRKDTHTTDSHSLTLEIKNFLLFVREEGERGERRDDETYGRKVVLISKTKTSLLFLVVGGWVEECVQWPKKKKIVPAIKTIYIPIVKS